MKGKIFSKFLCITVVMILLSGGFFGIYLPEIKKAKATAGVYYVDTVTGDDSRTTSQAENPATPWKTMIKAETAASTGNTVHVQTGIYVESSAVGGVTGNINYAKGITWIADGGNVTVRAASGGAVVNVAAAAVSGSGTASFTNFIFDSETNTRGNALNLTGASNKTFTSCQFLYGGYRGVIFIQGANSNVLITGSTLVNNTSANPLIYYYFSATGSVNFTNNTYTAASKGLLDAHSSNAASAIFSGGTFNYSGDAAGISIVNWAGSGALTFDGGDFNLSDRANYFLYLSGTTATGKITFTNNDVSGNMNLAGSGYIYATQRNDTIWINNNVFNLTHATVSSTLIRLHDNLNIQVKNNDITTESTALSSITVSSYNNVVMNPATISGNTVRTKSLTGMIITIGRDDPQTITGTGRLDGSIIENNTIYGPVYYDPDLVFTGSATHGIYMGFNKGYVRNNYVNGSGYGFVIKGAAYDWANASGYGVYSNIVINATVDAVILKGVKNTPVFNNTFYFENNPLFDLSKWQGAVDVVYNDADSSYVSTGATIYNNIMVARSTLDLIRVDSYSVTGFNANNNVYWVNNGATPQFQWSGSVKSTLAAWKTASSEGEASVFEDPAFYDQDSDDFHLMAESPAKLSGIATIPGTGGGSAIDVTTLDDYEGTQFVSSNPSIGALEADTTAPVVSGVTDGQITKTSLTITFNDGTATLNGSSFASGTVVSADGSYQLAVTDVYGNATTVDFIIDNDTPNINISDPANILASTTVSTYTIRGTMDDLLSGLASVDINGVALSVASADFTVNVNLVMGLNTFLITATDNAGNTGITPVYLTRTAVPISTVLPDRSSAIRRVFSPLSEATTDQTVNSLEAADNDDLLIPAEDLTIFNGSNYETIINGNATTYTEMPIFKGRTLPNSRVFLQIHSNEIISAEVMSDAAGNWSYQVQKNLSKGAHSLSITVKDALNNVISQKTYAFTVAEKPEEQTQSLTWIYYVIGVVTLISLMIFLCSRMKKKTG